VAVGGEKDCDQKEKGLYTKFNAVMRADGKSRHGQKHYGCEYFVLDLTHDRFAVKALMAYAGSCRAGGYIPLACDLEKKVVEMQERFLKESKSADQQDPS
jgi:hypothetical protein